MRLFVSCFTLLFLVFSLVCVILARIDYAIYTLLLACFIQITIRGEK